MIKLFVFFLCFFHLVVTAAEFDVRTFPVYIAEWTDGQKHIRGITEETLKKDLPAVLAQIDDTHFELAWATRAKCCYLLRFVTDDILKESPYEKKDILDALLLRLEDENESVREAARESYKSLGEK